jgi:hypothetical protein
VIAATSSDKPDDRAAQNTRTTSHKTSGRPKRPTTTPITQVLQRPLEPAKASGGACVPSAAMLIFDFEGVQPLLILRMPFEVMR